MAYDAWADAEEKFSAIADDIKLDPAIRQRLLEFDKILEFDLEIKNDDGTTRRFKAFRAQHNNALGPYKGGIRFMPTVNISDVKALAMWMTWKTSLVDVPFGGGKGGIAVDPNELSSSELKRLSQAYVRSLYPHMGPDRDIPAPDVNTNAEIMATMVDEYEKLADREAPAAFTGKPLNLGGSIGREEATGLGGVYILRQLAQKAGLKPENTRIAVQGYGNVGSYFTRLAHKMGFQIVAVSDADGAAANDQGINPERIIECEFKKGSVSGCPKHPDECSKLIGDCCRARKIDTEIVSNEELLELDVDVLVPAAIEDVITVENARRIQAPYIIEMANGPVSAPAERILVEKGQIVVPDILANSGGVTVSYFEWLQNRQKISWNRKQVYQKMRRLLVDAFARVWNQSKQDNSTLRQAAYHIAVAKVADRLARDRQRQVQFTKTAK